MNDVTSVQQFHIGGVSNRSMRAVYDFNARAVDALTPYGGSVLDLGVGSGRALSAVLQRRPDLKVTAIDLAPNMLSVADALFADEGTGNRVELIMADITSLPASVTDLPWDAITCTWTLHQLTSLDLLRAALGEIQSLRMKSSASVWIFDFQRLRSARTVPEMLTYMDPDMSPVLREDVIASEAAAFTQEELAEVMLLKGMDNFNYGLLRPMPLYQAAWAHGLGAAQKKGRLVGERKLSGKSRRDAARIRRGFSDKPF